jgi:hypothetical protein
VGETETAVTGIGEGALTLSDAEAVLPSLEARIAAVPGATAEMSPVPDTVAMLGLTLSHVTVRSVRGFPLES